MNNYDIVIIYTGLISYVAAVVQGVTTFGDAIVVHLLWRVGVILMPEIMASTPFGENHLLAATVLLTVRSFVVQIVFSYRSREFFCWKILRVLLPVQAFFVVLGGQILSRFEEATWLGPAMGFAFGVAAILFGLVSVRQVVRNRKAGVVERRDWREFDISTKVIQWMSVGGVGTGLMQGLVSIGGPPMMIVAVALDIPQPVLRGIFPFTSLFGFGVRLVECLFLGWIEVRSWMLFVSICMGAIAGLQVGIEISGSLPHDVFIVCVCWLMLFAAIAISLVPGFVVFGSFVVCGATFLGLHVWTKRHQRAVEARREAAALEAAAGRSDGHVTEEEERKVGFDSFAVPFTPSVPAVGVFPPATADAIAAAAALRTTESAAAAAAGNGGSR